jgi:hypothetical protein
MQPPRKNSNWLWWLLGIAGAAVALSIVGGLLIAGMVLKNVRVNRATREVEVSTPAGDLQVRNTPTKDAGLPVFPGAVLDEPGNNVELSFSGEQSVGITVLQYRSSDSLAKVDAWYRERLGPDFERGGPGSKHGKLDERGVNVGTDGIAYVSDKGDLMRFVAIKKKGGGAEIGLGRIGKREAQ